MPLRRCVRATALVVAALLWPRWVAAQTPAPEPQPQPALERRLLVVNKAEHSVSIFDAAARREVAVLPTGRGPHEVAVAADGAHAVITDYGDQKPGQTLTIVDPFEAKVLRTITLSASAIGNDGKKAEKAFLRPHGVQFVAATKVVVTSEVGRRLLLVDVTTGAIERTWPTVQGTMHMVALNADRTRAAATSIREGNVVFFDLATEGTASPPPIACGEQSEGLAICPRSGDTWVGNRAADTVSIVDATGKVTQTLDVGDFPFRLAFTPDGAHALVACAEGDVLQVFDGKTAKLVREVSMSGDRSEQGSLPMGITTDDEGKRAYVTCGRGEFVAVVDLAAGTVVDRLPARKGCDGIAWAVRKAPARVPITR